MKVAKTAKSVFDIQSKAVYTSVVLFSSMCIPSDIINLLLHDPEKTQVSLKSFIVTAR